MNPSRTSSAAVLAAEPENLLEVSIEASLKVHQEHLRRTQKDFRLQREESGKRIDKQSREIDRLEKERVDLDTDMRNVESRHHQHRDFAQTEELSQLGKATLDYDNAIKRERQRHVDVDRQIVLLEKKVAKLRASGGKAVEKSDGGKAAIEAKQRKSAVLENKVEKDTKMFNKLVDSNRELRDEIEHLRVEKMRFESMLGKMNTEITRLQTECQTMEEDASTCISQKNDTGSKLKNLKSKNERDERSHEELMRGFLRTIRHEELEQTFKQRKIDDRHSLKAEESAKKEGAERKSMAERRQMLRSYVTSFERIQRATSETEVADMIDVFRKKEEEKFALFKFVNELENELDRMHGELGVVERKMRNRKEEGTFYDDARSRKLESMQEALTSVQAARKNSEEQNVHVNAVLERARDVTRSAVRRVRAPEMFSDESSVTLNAFNEMLSALERRSNQLIEAAKFKKKGETRQSVDRQRLSAAAVTAEERVSLQVPDIRSDSDGFDSDSSGEPMSEQEIRKKVIRHVTDTTGRGSTRGDRAGSNRQNRKKITRIN